MTTLAKNKPREFVTGENNDLPAVATDIIYEGAFVGENGSGSFRPLVAGDPFAGVCERQCDNSAGLAGAKNVKVRQRGRIVCDVTGVTGITDEGSTVYASDDDTLTLASTSNSSFGKITRYISGTKCEIAFEAASVRSI